MWECGNVKMDFRNGNDLVTIVQVLTKGLISTFITFSHFSE